MTYAILTPTYKPHFQYVKKYLESFDKFVVDKKDIPIYFTISKQQSEIPQRTILVKH